MSGGGLKKTKTIQEPPSDLVIQTVRHHPPVASTVASKTQEDDKSSHDPKPGIPQ